MTEGEALCSHDGLNDRLYLGRDASGGNSSGKASQREKIAVLSLEG